LNQFARQLIFFKNPNFQSVLLGLETDIQILEQQLQQASFPKLDACDLSYMELLVAMLLSLLL
jgi:hypothetical protein